MANQFEPDQLAAAELADRYIEIVLSTKAELLLSNHSAGDGTGERYAKRLLEFRETLIDGLVEQPLTVFEED